MDCIFCKIVNGDIPSYTIYEDDLVKVFLDVNPDVDGHTLIIPKKHYLDLFDIENETLIHILEVAKNINTIFTEKLDSKGLTLVQNNGLYQEVKHFHLHLKPHFENGICQHKISDVKEIYDKLKSI